MNILNTITEWLVSISDSIIAFVFTFVALIIAFLMLLIGSLFEDENSIYCESLDSPWELCESNEWVEAAVDPNGDIHYIDFDINYIDFDNVEIANEYHYFWEMTNYSKPTDEHLSIATYFEADCGLNRVKPLIFNAYTQEMALGKPETLNLKEDWDYPKPYTLGDTILSLVCKRDNRFKDSYYGNWYEVSTHVDGSSSFYMDPDSIREKDGNLTFWTLIDYASPMKDMPLKILSQVSRMEVSCEENKLRNEVIIDYDDNMGKGEMKLLNESPSTDWMTPPPGSNYGGYIQFGCKLNKLSDEEMEEIKIEWKSEMQEDS